MNFGKNRNNMTTRTIYVTVRIDYEFDETQTNSEESVWDAEHLAIQTNYNSVQNGVKIESVEICGENFDEN